MAEPLAVRMTGGVEVPVVLSVLDPESESPRPQQSPDPIRSASTPPKAV